MRRTFVLVGGVLLSSIACTEGDTEAARSARLAERDRIRAEREAQSAAQRATRDEQARQFSPAAFTKALQPLEARVKRGDFTKAREEMNQRLEELQPVMRSERATEPAVAAAIARFNAVEQAIVAAELAVSGSTSSSQRAAATSSCTSIRGESTRDTEHATQFCERAITSSLGLVGVQAMQSLLWIQVSRQTADAMRRDPLTTEQLIRTWMQAWRKITGHHSVTVFVQWGDVEIAKGDTSVFSGDQVRIR